MITPDAWQGLAAALAEFRGPVLEAEESATLRAAVERCADDARSRKLSAEGMIKELRNAFAASSLSVTRETYLHLGAHAGDDQLVTKMVSWALTRFFASTRRPARGADIQAAP
ncbi:MAG TPA: hypothetical protein VGM50_06830 [Gemmatimonadaceae bacterium]|jgi:hypothetical protein